MYSSLPTLSHVRQLGTGPYAKVFLAKDESGKNQFALKYLTIENFPEDMQALIAHHFEQRIEKSSQLQHENIVNTIGFYADKKSSIMEFIQGQNLRRYVLSKGGRLRTDSVISLIESLSNTLSLAHKNNFLHLDLKPENIFIETNGVIKLSDFAFAPRPFFPGSLTGADESFYPPSPYSSPEELSDEPVGQASDVFSLAVVIYEALTGFLPFNVNPAQLTWQALISAETRPFPNDNSAFSNATQTTLARALHRDINQRCDSVEEFRSDLIAALQGSKMAALVSVPNVPTPGTPTIRENARPEQKIKLISTFGDRGEDAGQFLELSGIAIGPNQIIAGDVLARRIQVFSKNGKWLFNLKSRPENTLKKTTPSATGGLFSSPAYVCTDDSGIIYATDSSDHYIRLYDRQGFFIKEVRNHPGKDGGLQGIACDLKGHLYVCDVDNNAVQVLSSASGNWLRSIGSRGSGPGQMQYPAGLTLDKKGNVYVVDYALSRIAVFNNDGRPLTTLGKKGNGPGEFNVPRDVAIDRHGNIFVCDSLNHRIQVFASDGRFLYSFGGSGREEGRFLGPSSLAIDPEKQIMYIADRGNNRIQIFQLPSE